MKNIFWVFTIRKRISRVLKNVVKEQAFFESERVKLIHSGKQDAGNYLASRIEMKKEVVSILRNLLT